MLTKKKLTEQGGKAMGKHGYLILCTGLAADKKKKALKYYFEFELSKSLSHKVLKYTVLMKINY